MQSEGDGITNATDRRVRTSPWLEGLKRHDPEVTYVSICVANWTEEIGKAIGSSPFLKDLTIWLNGSDHNWVQGVCRWLPRNRSIETLKFVEESASVFDDRDIFSCLALFIKKNKKFRNIKFHCDNRSFWTIDSIVKALSSCSEGQLERIQLSGFRCTDEKAARFIDSLNKHVGLLKLSIPDLFDNTNHDNDADEEYRDRAYDALANLLENPASKIQKLRVRPDFEIMEILSHALIENNSLTSLDLSSGFITHDFLAVLAHPLCSLEKLIMIGPVEFYDEDIACLGNALAVNNKLMHLQYHGHNNITEIGWGAFSNCLRSSKSALEVLDLGQSLINDENASIIISALAINSCLQILHMNRQISFATKSRVWEVLSRTLCDMSSIDSIAFSSNHTLHTCPQYAPKDVVSLLEMNKHESNAGSARRKILKYKLSEGKSYIHAFAQMPEAVLPCAIGWVGRDRHGYSAMYNLLRCLPSLVCGSCSNRCNDAAGTKKRKLLCTRTTDTNTIV